MKKKEIIKHIVIAIISSILIELVAFVLDLTFSKLEFTALAICLYLSIIYVKEKNEPR